MKKQKTVIMLENIKENMLGEKHESSMEHMHCQFLYVSL